MFRVGDLETFSAHNILEKYGSGTIGLRSTNKKRGDSTDKSREQPSKFYKFFGNTTVDKWEYESARPKYLSRQ